MSTRTPIPADLRETAILATERQASYLEALRDGKDISSLSDEQQKWLTTADFKTIPKMRASSVIETLTKLPWKPRNEQEASEHEVKRTSPMPVSMYDIPDGYYAVEGVEGHKNETSFYRLRSPKQGNWVGYQFLDQVVGHGKRYPVKGEPMHKIIALIKEQGIDPCRMRYGQEIGACGRCGRELTDDTSRSRGIGPDCWDKMGH